MWCYKNKLKDGVLLELGQYATIEQIEAHKFVYRQYVQGIYDPIIFKKKVCPVKTEKFLIEIPLDAPVFTEFCSGDYSQKVLDVINQRIFWNCNDAEEEEGTLLLAFTRKFLRKAVYIAPVIKHFKNFFPCWFNIWNYHEGAALSREELAVIDETVEPVALQVLKDVYANKILKLKEIVEQYRGVAKEEAEKLRRSAELKISEIEEKYAETSDSFIKRGLTLEKKYIYTTLRYQKNKIVTEFNNERKIIQNEINKNSEKKVRISGLYI